MIIDFFTLLTYYWICVVLLHSECLIAQFSPSYILEYHKYYWEILLCLLCLAKRNLRSQLHKYGLGIQMRNWLIFLRINLFIFLLKVLKSLTPEWTKWGQSETTALGPPPCCYSWRAKNFCDKVKTKNINASIFTK